MDQPRKIRELVEFLTQCRSNEQIYDDPTVAWLRNLLGKPCKQYLEVGFPSVKDLNKLTKEFVILLVDRLQTDSDYGAGPTDEDFIFEWAHKLRNTHRRWIRNARATPLAFVHDAEHLLTTDDPTPAQEADERESLALLQDELDKLGKSDSELREVIRLRYVERKSLQEISETMGWKGTTKAFRRVNKALTILKRKMLGEDE